MAIWPHCSLTHTPHTHTQSVRAVIVVHASANDHEILVTICDDFECGRGGGGKYSSPISPFFIFVGFVSFGFPTDQCDQVLE